MKKRDFKRILFEKTEHFTIDGIPFARSGADAQSLIGIGNCASFATTLRRAMLVADMDEDTREMALRILDRAERKEHRHEPKVALRRRAVIAAVATVVLSYFTLVPQGRAFAKSVYEFVVNFFENGIIVVENENSPDDAHTGSAPKEILRRHRPLCLRITITRIGRLRLHIAPSKNLWKQSARILSS